ncbi:hypothetical protein [Streptomyces sp. NPDC002685]|uniref:hypothetical protein n=1 Tax=Streptomyces sp. NPDC002685 TaxID=3154540 RepID=UPI003323A186
MATTVHSSFLGARLAAPGQECSRARKSVQATSKTDSPDYTLFCDEPLVFPRYNLDISPGQGFGTPSGSNRVDVQNESDSEDEDARETEAN